MLTDYHIHSRTSIDSKEEIENYCKKAIELGFSEICITNHHEWESVDNGTYNYAMTDEQAEECFAEILEMRKKYPNLKIKFGVEIGYYENREKEILDFIKKFPFDYILGAVHVMDGRFITGEDLVEASKEESIEVYRRYFELLTKAVKFGYMDSIAHIDLPRKQTPLEFSEYKEFVLPLIEVMKEKDMFFEINTGGFRRHMKEQYPTLEFLRLLRESGLTKITMGSDCHSVEEFGCKVQESIDFLKEEGFSGIYTFDKRKPIFNKF